MKLFVTGGHVTPALAVIEELQRLSQSTEILFIGRKIAMEGDTSPSFEYQIVTERGIHFLPIITGRFPRYLSPTIFYSLLKFPIGILQAIWYLLRYRPHAVFSFGGYVGLPICIAARLFGIPVYIHEQAAVPGLANKIIAGFSKKIFLSFREQAKAFPQGKTMVTGLPLRQSLFHPPKHPSFSYEKNIPLLYITGGSTGAKTLNEIFFSVIPRLTKTYMIIHQTGEKSFDGAKQYANKYYYPKATFKESDVSWLYHNAVLVVGRSGANTVGEIAALGVVGLFIPLPWSAGNEQEKNAQLLVDKGFAKMVLQKNIKPKLLIRTIDEMISHSKSYKAQAIKFSKQVPRNAATIIAQEVCRRTFENTGNG